MASVSEIETALRGAHPEGTWETRAGVDDGRELPLIE